MDEEKLISTLEKLTPSQLGQVIVRLKGTSKQLPLLGTHHERVVALVEYMRSPSGQGMDQLAQAVDKVVPKERFALESPGDIDAIPRKKRTTITTIWVYSISLGVVIILAVMFGRGCIPNYPVNTPYSSSIVPSDTKRPYDSIIISDKPFSYDENKVIYITTLRNKESIAVLDGEIDFVALNVDGGDSQISGGIKESQKIVDKKVKFGRIPPHGSIDIRQAFPANTKRVINIDMHLNWEGAK